MKTDKKTGLYKKYLVTKLSNPEKEMDCIVLEFDDPIARVGIKAWAKQMEIDGYEHVAADVYAKLRQLEDSK